MNPAAVAVPAVIGTIGILFLASKKNTFDAFLQGAKDGLVTSFNLVPTLIALIVAVSMFRASGAMGIMTELLAPLFALLRIPSELISFIIIRPLSGSGSTAMLSDIFREYGADSFAGRAASVMMGASDTVFYIFAVYFGAVRCKRAGEAVFAALLAQVFCAVLACALVGWFW